MILVVDVIGTRAVWNHYIQDFRLDDPTMVPMGDQFWPAFRTSNTFLPAAIMFNAHPDNSASGNLVIEVDFSTYQTLNGIMVPTRIQRSLQGNVLVDITVTGASFNTGLPLSDFTIN
jgi:hypothetical protein